MSGVTNQSANFTVEVWVAADREPGDNVYHLLTIYNRRLPADFVICQWQQECLLRATIQPPSPTRKINEVGVTHALPEGKSGFITIRGDGAGTDFYLDGLSTKHYPQFVLQPDALTGQLILGNDASGKHPWTGKWFGLALYDRALDAAEIARHHALWIQGRAGQLTHAPGLAALYLFDEGGGQLAKDASGHRHRVLIPETFQAVHKKFLIPPWDDLAYDHPDYPDIAVNILGFAPFGFCFFLHLNFRKTNQRIVNVLLVVFAGAGVSLAIEIIQAWLPNRTSSATDLITNIIGAMLGAVLALAVCRQISKAGAKSGNPSFAV